MPNDGHSILGVEDVTQGVPVEAAPALSGHSVLGVDPTLPTQPTTVPAPPVGHAVAGPTDTQSWLPSMKDIGRNIGTGVVNTMTSIAGMLPNAASAPGAAEFGAKPQPTPQQMRDNAFNRLGITEYQPATLGGRLGQNLASSIPAAVAMGPGAIPAVAGGALAGGAMNEAEPDHPLLSAAASLLGGKVGAGVANFGAAATGLKPPAGGSLPIEDAQLAQRAQALGIPLNIAQVSRSPAAKYAYSLTGKMPMSGAHPFEEAQRGSWTRAVTKTFGEDSDKVTPEVLQAARDRIGNDFNGVAARTTIPMSNQFMTDLQGIVNRAKLTMSADSVKPVENQAMNIVDTAANNGGDIGGRAYIDLTAKGGPLDTMMQSSDSGLRQAGIQLRSIIDNHLQANAAPQDLATLQQARAQWKAMKTVEPLTLRADTPGSATPSTGDINPAALRSAVNQSYKNAALAPLGKVPLNDLAKIGQRFLKEPGSSGSGERWALGTMGVGAMEAMREGVNPAMAVGAPIAGMAASRLTNSVLRNQMLAKQMVAASLNPNGFQFNAPVGPLAALPFSWASANRPRALPNTP